MIDKLLENLAVESQPFALCQIDDGWRLRLPSPPVVVLHFVLKGCGAAIGKDGAARPIGPHSMIVIPAGGAHILEGVGEVANELNIESPPDEPGICEITAGDSGDPDLIVACGMVHARYGECVGLFDSLPDVLAVDLSDVPHVGTLFEGVMAEKTGASPGSRIMLAALMTQLLVHMFRKLAADENTVMPWVQALEEPRLAKAIDFVCDDPGAQHSVESLADRAAMSRSAFSEHFTKAFGRSPMNFVNHIRMERAARMLKEGSTSIDAVASKVGFSSRSHFSQAFKKHMGLPPAEYRHH